MWTSRIGLTKPERPVVWVAVRHTRTGVYRVARRRSHLHPPDVDLYFWWKTVIRQMGPLITQAEAGRMLGVSRQTIVNRVNSAHLRQVKPLGWRDTRAGLVPLADVQKMLEDELTYLQDPKPLSLWPRPD